MTSKARNNPAAVLERLIFNNRPAVVVICVLISGSYFECAQVRRKPALRK